jgi:Beta-galactosidase
MRVSLIVASLVLTAIGFFSNCARAADQALVQVHIPALPETGRIDSSGHGFRLGGNAKDGVVLHPNIDDIRHIMLNPDDLRDASITVKIAAPSSQGGSLALYELTRDPASPSAIATDDFAPTPIAVAPIPPTGGLVTLHGSLADVLNQNLKDPNRNHGLLLVTKETAAELKLLPAPTVIAAEGEHFSSLSVDIVRYPNVSLFPQPLRPTDGIYTQVIGGHLSYDNQRLRLWGVCRHFWGGPTALDRIAKMGFNAVRIWGPRNAYDEKSAHEGVMVADPGTLDNADSLASFDKNVADAKKRGLFVWMAGIHYDPMGIMHKSTANGLLGATASGSFLEKQFGQDADWDAWKKSILAFTGGKAGRMAHVVSELAYFDPRLKEIYRRHIINLLNHVNPYTGKKYAADEAIATWELNNEEGFVTTTLEYGDNDFPEFFRDELQTQWCQWLKKKYATDDALRQAWGDLRPGESLGNNSVKFAPLLRQRLDYPPARGSDIVHFCSDVTNAFNQEMRNVCRAQAPAGVGAAVVPIIFDTQALPGAQWLYNDSLGDAVSFGNYQFTYHSSLTIPPGMFIMDDQTVLNKPTLIYETQSLRIDPFRAEYPLRTAALASWQNWDGVFWHYWKGMGAESDEAYQAAPLDYPGPGYSDGGLYPDEDPAFCSVLSIAGQAFLRGAIDPATNPVVHAVPLKDVYNFANFHGVETRRDTFTRGAAITFPTTDDAQPATANPATQPAVQDATQCGSQIVYDWPHGRMMIDTPTMKAYVGQTHGAYRFSDGIAVDGFSTPFVMFAMLSADGKPLVGPDPAKQIYIAAQFNSQNTGFRMTDTGHRGGESVGWDGGWSNSFVSTILDRGHAPIVTDNVTCTIHFPTQLSGHLESYDFALRQIADQPIDSNSIHRNMAGTYLSMLYIDSRGAAVATPSSNTPADGDPQATGAANPGEHPDPALAHLFMPISTIGWGESYDAVHQYLGESTLVFSSLTKPTTRPAQQTNIKLTQAEAIFTAPADIELFFTDQKLNRITAAFAKASSPKELTQSLTAQFGTPASGANQDLIWTQHQDGASLTITLSTSGEKTVITLDVKK